MGKILIPPDSRKKLIRLARQTLEAFVLEKVMESGEIDDPYLWAMDYGAFVGLHKEEELRGCIGTCFPDRPLYETVIEMTQAAASRDHRVAPVAASELSEIRIDISVLSPLELVADPLALKVGEHGLHVARGSKRGVLLPQVATHWGWDNQTFLSETCVKAGLSKNAWKSPGTEISIFTTLIIEEEPWNAAAL